MRFYLLLFMMMWSSLSAGVTTQHCRKHRRPSQTSFALFHATHRSVASENFRANQLGIPQIKSFAALHEAVEDGRLIPIGLPCQKLLPLERRYVLPATEEFLEQLNAEFQNATGTSLVVDSAIRPVNVQRHLIRWNRNAAPAYGERASTHERGTTVDLSRRMKKSDYHWLMIRLAYYQLRGKVLVIEESTCIHIFVGEDIHDQDIAGYTVQALGSYELEDTGAGESAGPIAQPDTAGTMAGWWFCAPYL